MSIGDVARRTYIQPKFIQAIEEDNLGVLPSSHWKFFVREYAKVVNLDPEEVLALLPADAPVPQPVPVEPVRAAVPKESEAQRARELRNVLGGISLGERERGGMSGWLIGVAAVLLLAIGVYYFFFREDGESGGESVAVIASDDTTMGSPGDVISTPAGDSIPAADSIPLGDSLTLEGRATARVWYTIVMDSKRSETGTLDSGATKTWRASKNFKLSLGNAGGLQFFLNERSIGTLGPKSSVVRNQVIDATGLVRRNPARRTPTRQTTRRTQPREDRPITPTEVRPPASLQDGD